MDEEFKFYKLSYFYLIFPFSFGIVWLIFGYNCYLIQDHDKDVLMLWIFISYIHFQLGTSTYLNPQLSTTSDKIIIMNLMLKPKIIRIKDIIRIDRRSLNNFQIFYRNENNNQKKHTLKLYFLKEEDRLSFNKYIQTIIDKINSPAVIKIASQ